MTVVEQVRADIGALIYRHTPRGQLVSSSSLRDLLDRLVDGARAEGALKPGEAPAVAVDPSAARLRAELGVAADALDRAARAIELMAEGLDSADGAALAAALSREAVGFRKVAAA